MPLFAYQFRWLDVADFALGQLVGCSGVGGCACEFNRLPEGVADQLATFRFQMDERMPARQTGGHNLQPVQNVQLCRALTPFAKEAHWSHGFYN
jgi:hypothetical protein